MPKGSAWRCLRPKDAGTEADPTIWLHFLSSLDWRPFPGRATRLSAAICHDRCGIGRLATVFDGAIPLQGGRTRPRHPFHDPGLQASQHAAPYPLSHLAQPAFRAGGGRAADGDTLGDRPCVGLHRIGKRCGVRPARGGGQSGGPGFDLHFLLRLRPRGKALQLLGQHDRGGLRLLSRYLCMEPRQLDIRAGHRCFW